MILKYLRVKLLRTQELDSKRIPQNWTVTTNPNKKILLLGGNKTILPLRDTDRSNLKIISSIYTPLPLTRTNKRELKLMTQ
jgi:hypothetical protein